MILRSGLASIGFGWIVGQAQAQIAEGKPSIKHVSEYERVLVSDDPIFTIPRPRSRRASLITTEPYIERTARNRPSGYRGSNVQNRDIAALEPFGLPRD
jgi:hypothetical protein